MKIFLERTQETKKLDFTGTAKELITMLGMNTEELLIIRNGELVTEDEQLENTDQIKLLSVISGG